MGIIKNTLLHESAKIIICKPNLYKQRGEMKWDSVLPYIDPPNNFEFKVTTDAPSQIITKTSANSGPPSDPFGVKEWAPCSILQKRKVSLSGWYSGLFGNHSLKYIINTTILQNDHKFW